MSFTTGTATDMNDLIGDLRTWLTVTLSTWTELEYTAGAGVYDATTFSVQGDGPDASRRVYVNMETEHDSGNNYHTFKARMALDYDSALSRANQLGASPLDTYTLGWDASMNYWFYANARRFIVVIKVNTTYSFFHAGMFLPWSTASEYDFPYYIAGDNPHVDVYTELDSNRNFFIRPAPAVAHWRDWNGNWGQVENQIANQPSSNRPITTAAAYIWPQGFGSNTGNNFPSSWAGTDTGHSAEHFLDHLEPTEQDELPFFPCLLGVNTADASAVSNQGLIGALDGVWTVPGVGVTAEQTITFDSRTFRLFPNISRLNGANWIAIEEV
jgi:hypothetical protein